MDVPKRQAGREKAETDRVGISDMETHLTWIEGIIMLLKREAEDIAPGLEGDMNTLAVRLNFMAHALELEVSALREIGRIMPGAPCPERARTPP